MANKGVSIKAKITLTLVFLPLLSLLAVGALALFQNRNSLAKQAEISLEQLILEKTRGYNYIFERIQQEVEAAAHSSELIFNLEEPNVKLGRRMLMPWTGKGYGSPKLEAELKEEILRLERMGHTLEVIVSNNPYLTLGYLATPSGITVFDQEEVVGIIEELEAFDPRVRPWYLEARTAKDTIWTQPYVDAHTKKLTVTAATPAYNASGRLIGVVGFDVLLETLQNDILSMDIGYENYAFMIDGEGNVLVSPEIGETDARWNEQYQMDNLLETQNLAFKEIVRKMILGTSGIDLYKTGALDENYVAYAPIPSIKSSIGIVVPKSEIVRPVEESGKLIIIVVGVIIIIALEVGIILGNQVTRPIEELTVMVEKASRGLTEVEQIPIKRRDEIGILANSFNRMISNLDVVIKELEEREARKT